MYFAGTVEVTVMATFVRVGDKTKAIIRKQGFPTKAKTFLRLTDAKKWAKRLEAQIESGSVDSNVVLRYYTLKDSLKHYFTSCERRNLKALDYSPVLTPDTLVGQYFLWRISRTTKQRLCRPFLDLH